MNVDISAEPFNLSAEDAAWVKDTLAGMSLERKVGQLFFLEGVMAGRAKIVKSIEEYGPGGVMYRTAPSGVIAADHRALQAKSAIPLFLAANIEAGGNGLVTDGTQYGTQMLVGASGDSDNARRLGEVAASEAAAVGGNRAFAPIVDINWNWRNPITNTRSYGDDPELVGRMGAGYVRGAMAAGCAVTIKHFPGDGCDGRDQHIATTVNSLSYDDWMATYGEVYREAIAAGANGLMVGHIAFPAYADRVAPDRPGIRDLPATLSPVIVTRLLREELGFKGLTMTDASLMTGFLEKMPRSEAVPASVAAGCDMFLFQKDLAEDFGFMMAAVKDGRLTTERVDEAVTRILAVKAQLGLHRKSPAELVPGDLDAAMKARHAAWARELADEAITLVDDGQGLLPLDPVKRRRIAYIPIGGEADFMDMLKKLPGVKGALIKAAARIAGAFSPPPAKTLAYFSARLRAEGFDVDVIDYGNVLEALKVVGKSVSEFKASYDLVVYASLVGPMSNSTNLQLRYTMPGGLDAPWMVREVPTMFVSFGSPYHGYEAPMIPTFINAYAGGAFVVDALVEKLRGRSAFKGRSPVRLDFKEFEGRIR
ncbi:MAG: glycoside hydrolase family 3 protein [Spirochaetes bacterium]|nr:glycoside hydrolase family 3 protein [Spirochaetota bacterium]